MSIKSLQDYTYYSKYARYNASEKRRETWDEAVARVESMHLRRYPQVEEHIKWAFDLVREKRVLGSQRALQFGGRPIERQHARIYNCSASYCDRPRFFQESLFLLLCGSGVGFSVQRHHIVKQPPFFPVADREERCYVVPDTIEGWSDSLGVLLATYLPHPEFLDWRGHKVHFDFSQIRPEGSLLSSGAGKAPGPEPLKRALTCIRSLLDACINRGEKRLRPIDAYDIVMHASDAVLSGGIRRSASLCMFSPDDDEMVKAKTGDWFIHNPQRARSNNSVVLLRDGTDKEQFLDLIESVKQFGEPGFIWTQHLDGLFNPCVEVNLFGYDEDGNSGWQTCNLSEINGKKIKCKQDFALASRAAAIVGTLQAGYTDFPYLGEITEQIIRREALLGVSITGMMDNPDILFNPANQREMAQLVIETNEWMAALIDINPAARCTCIKPAGTTSCVLGSASGVHPHHARRYFRRVQANKLESVLQHFQTYNPHAVEKSVWSANGTDSVITFCIEVPAGSKTKNDLSGIELLKHVQLTQQNWVSFGKVESRCVQPWLSHNVSNTINVSDNEWDDVAGFIYDNRKYFAGISLIPQSGDLDYPQAPMCNVLTPRAILQEYGDCCMLASGLIVDGLHAFENLWQACETALEFREADNSKKEDWVRRVKQFAKRYLNNDVRKCTYLLKQVHHWKLWLDLNREYTDVNYTELYEEEDNTKPIEEVACANGKCELMFT